MGFLQTTDKKFCTGCGACVQACSFDAIHLVEDEFGFSYPKVTESKCVHCNRCVNICPIDNPRVVFHNTKEGNAVGGYAKDRDVREASSSGGFFTGIVKAFWGEGAVVFGAEQLSDLSVAHTSADKFEDISKFRKSKYSPSDTRRTFVEVKGLLEEGRRVIYSGTPCQVAGLLSYLGRNYDNLLTIDLVCHGHFAPRYFRMERAYYEKKFKSRAIGFEYRDKANGHWKGHVVSWKFANGKRKCWQQKDAPYYRVWLAHLISRPSCTNCRFAVANRVADISIGDYWHVPETSIMYGGNHGTSVAFGNTGKGRLILERLKGSYVWEAVDRNRMTAYKLAMHGSIKANPRSAEAMDDLLRLSYRQFLRKWCREGFSDRLRQLKHIIGSWVRKNVRRSM